MFIHTFGAKSDKVKWSGTDGCIPSIRKALSNPPTTQIAYILEDVLQFIKEGLYYTSESRPSEDGHVGRKPFILMETWEAQITANCIGYCTSFWANFNAVNLHQ